MLADEPRFGNNQLKATMMDWPVLVDRRVSRPRLLGPEHVLKYLMAESYCARKREVKGTIIVRAWELDNEHIDVPEGSCLYVHGETSIRL